MKEYTKRRLIQGEWLRKDKLECRLEPRGIKVYGRLPRQNPEKHNFDNHGTIMNEAS